MPDPTINPNTGPDADPNTRPGAERPMKRDPRFAARSTHDPAATRAFAVQAAMCLRDEKCEDLLVLDVSKISQVTDYIVIGTGSSDRQMRAALSHLSAYGEEAGFPAYHRSTDERGTWLLADFVDVVAHLFEPNARAHYDLEMLWGDAPRVEVPDGPGPLASKHRKGAG